MNDVKDELLNLKLEQLKSSIEKLEKDNAKNYSELNKEISKVLDQALKTNGRVNKLERFINILSGAIIASVAIGGGSTTILKLLT